MSRELQRALGLARRGAAFCALPRPYHAQSSVCPVGKRFCLRERTLRPLSVQGPEVGLCSAEFWKPAMPAIGPSADLTLTNHSWVTVHLGALSPRRTVLHTPRVVGRHGGGLATRWGSCACANTRARGVPRGATLREGKFTAVCTGWGGGL